MKDEDKLVNAIIALQQTMVTELGKVNLGIQELRLSYMKMADDVIGLRSDFNKYAQRNDDRAGNHETRITHLEETFGGIGMAKEPVVPYKKRKKRK